VTAVGLGTAYEFRASFPQVAYHQIRPGEPLPFDDDAFDIAASNAVLEHVGSDAAQRVFVAELVRVAARVFISVPHRFFPVEHHTAIPFAHWTDRTFRLACRALGKNEWSDPQNLILMTRERLRQLHPAGVIGMTGIRLGSCSSNIFILIDRSRHP
jgi:SAM-dependent methyltransferase